MRQRALLVALGAILTLSIPASRAEVPKLSAKAQAFRKQIKQLCTNGEQTKAMSLSEQLIKSEPKSGEGYFNKGEVFSSEERYDDAAKSFAESCKRDPEREGYWYSQGRAALAAEQLPLAEQCLKKSAQLNPRGRGTFLRLGQVYMEEGKFDLAIENYKKHIEIEKKDDRTMFRLADAYKAAKQWQNAADVYGRLLKLFPQDEQAMRLRGDCYFELGSYQQAVDDYTASIDTDAESSSSVFKARANAYTKLKKSQLAAADMKRYEESLRHH